MRKEVLVPATILLLACGCASAPAPQPPPAPPPPAPAAPSPSGAVTMKTLAEPETGGPQVEVSTEEHVPPITRDKPPMPAFPKDALAAGAEGFVVVRILIDTEGKVAEVTGSPKGESSPGPFAAAFRAAVDQSVRSWRFQPGRIDYLRPGKDLDGDGKPDYTVVDHYAFTPYVYDLRFDFRIAAGAPAVDSKKLGAGPAS